MDDVLPLFSDRLVPEDSNLASWPDGWIFHEGVAVQPAASAFSRQIHDLETEMGVALFERAPVCEIRSGARLGCPAIVP
jgi:hypothetical protein